MLLHIDDFVPGASLRRATRLEGYASAGQLCIDDDASAGRLRVDDFAPLGLALMCRLPRGPCMPRRGGSASTTLPSRALLRRAAHLEGHASAEQPRVDDFASTGRASTRRPPRQLYRDWATFEALLPKKNQSIPTPEGPGRKPIAPTRPLRPVPHDFRIC